MTKKKQWAWFYVREHANIVVLEISPTGTILSANRFAETLTGKKLVGTQFSDIIVDFQLDGPIEQWLQPTTTPRLINITTSTGLPQTFYASIWHINGIILFFAQTDIHEQELLRKELISITHELSEVTRALEVKNVELSRLHELKNQFLGMAAHDLRRPLGLILTYTDYLIEDLHALLPEQDMQYLQSIRTAVDRMSRLVNDFLDVSLIDAGRFPLEISPTKIDTVLLNAYKLVELGAWKRNVVVTFDIEPHIPPWNADGPKLEEVLANLLSNAIEHSPQNSEVRVGCHQTDQGLRIWVSDFGPGISEEKKKTLLLAFSGTLQQKSDGHRSIGLGLVIANKIINAHGGQLTIDSVPGKGSTFAFTLPSSIPTQP